MGIHLTAILEELDEISIVQTCLEMNSKFHPRLRGTTKLILSVFQNFEGHAGLMTHRKI